MALGLGACGPKERPPEIPPPPPTAAPRNVVSTPDAGTPPAEAGPPPLVLEPIDEPPPAEPSAHVDIKFPIAEQRFSLAKAKKYTVRVTVEHWKTGHTGDGVEISLDGERPRRLTGGTIALTDLGRRRPGTVRRPPLAHRGRSAGRRLSRPVCKADLAGSVGPGPLLDW